MRTEQGTETSVLGKFGSVLGKICPGLPTAVVGGLSPPLLARLVQIAFPLNEKHASTRSRKEKKLVQI